MHGAIQKVLQGLDARGAFRAIPSGYPGKTACPASETLTRFMHWGEELTQDLSTNQTAYYGAALDIYFPPEDFLPWQKAHGMEAARNPLAVTTQDNLTDMLDFIWKRRVQSCPHQDKKSPGHGIEKFGAAQIELFRKVVAAHPELALTYAAFKGSYITFLHGLHEHLEQTVTDPDKVLIARKAIFSLSNLFLSGAFESHMIWAAQRYFDRVQGDVRMPFEANDFGDGWKMMLTQGGFMTKQITAGNGVVRVACPFAESSKPHARADIGVRDDAPDALGLYELHQHISVHARTHHAALSFVTRSVTQGIAEPTTRCDTDALGVFIAGIRRCEGDYLRHRQICPLP